MHFLDSPLVTIALVLLVPGLALLLLFHRAAEKHRKEGKANLNTRRQRPNSADTWPAAGNARQTAYRDGHSDHSDNFGVPQQAAAETGPLINHDLNTVMAYQPAHAGQTNGPDTTGGTTTSMALGGVTANPRDYVMVREVQKIVPAKEQRRQQEDINNIDVDKNFDAGDITGQLKGA